MQNRSLNKNKGCPTSGGTLQASQTLDGSWPLLICLTSPKKLNTSITINFFDSVPLYRKELDAQLSNRQDRFDRRQSYIKGTILEGGTLKAATCVTGFLCNFWPLFKGEIVFTGDG